MYCMYGDNKVYPLYKLTNPKIDNSYPWYIYCMYGDNKLYPLDKLTNPKIENSISLVYALYV